MPIRLLFTLLLLPHLAYATPNAEHLQTIRSLAFNACSNLLVRYNPNQSDSNPRYTERYQQALDQLSQLVAQEKDPLLSKLASELNERIQKLEQQPANRTELYPVWINPVLESQARLDLQASVRYASAPPVEAMRQALHQLMLNVERLLLLYETRSFGSLAVYVKSMNETSFAQLDHDILQSFLTLKQRWPQHAHELDKLMSKYDYIRPHLLKHDLAPLPGGAAYYLGQVNDGLARIDSK